MTLEQLKEHIKESAKTQGFFGELLERLDRSESNWEKLHKMIVILEVNTPESFDKWIFNCNYFRNSEVFE